MRESASTFSSLPPTSPTARSDDSRHAFQIHTMPCTPKRARCQSCCGLNLAKYFDPDGTPVSPYCKVGHKCGFVHPSSPYWSTAKYASGKQPPSHYDRARRHSRSASPRRTVNSPSQSRDVGTLKVEDKADDTQLLRGVEHEETQDVSMHMHSRYAPRTENVSPRRDSPPFSPPASPTVNSHPVDDSNIVTDSLRTLRGKREVVADIVELTRQLVSATHQAARESEIANEQHQKVQTYTQMSVALSRINHPSSSAVAPVLSEIVASHQTATQRTDFFQDRIEELWRNILVTVVEGVSAELDVVASTATARLKREGSDIMEGLIADAVARERKMRTMRGITGTPTKQQDDLGDLRSNSTVGLISKQEVAGQPIQQTRTPDAASGSNTSVLGMMQAMMKMLQQQTVKAQPATQASTRMSPLHLPSNNPSFKARTEAEPSSYERRSSTLESNAQWPRRY